MPKADLKKEMTTDQIKGILDEFAEQGVLWLLLTGGEPLVRPDFEEIYIYAKKKGFFVIVFSNGTLIDERIIELFKKYQPFLVEITMHSMNEEVFEQITQIKGSFKKTMRGIKLLHDSDIKFKLKTVAMRQNKNDIQGVKEYCDSLGVKHTFDPHIQPKVTQEADPLGARLSAEEIVELDSSTENLVRAWKGLYERTIQNPPNVVFLCGAGARTFYVNAEGKMSPCTMTRYHSYDLLNGTFDEAWHDFIPKVVCREPSSDYKCGKCRLMSICGRCPGWSYLEAKDEEASIDFLCELGALRKKAFESLPDEENTDETEGTI
jgi:radical SAM protein with 4Fe4S-binding SPASM domain